MKKFVKRGREIKAFWDEIKDEEHSERIKQLILLQFIGKDGYYKKMMKRGKI